jgi:uncharacterized membrane protein YbhN (UPF0104 family)
LGRLDWERLLVALAEPVWTYVVVAVIMQAVGKVLWVSRWKDTLHASGMERSFSNLMALLFVGLFFGTFLPSAMGGDVIRGYYTAHNRQQLVTSYAAVIVERALGLVTLSAVAASAAGLALLTGSGLPARDLLVWVAVAGGGLTLAGGTAFAWRGWGDLPATVGSKGRLPRLVAGIAAGFDLFWRPGTRRLRILMASFGLQFIAVGFYLSCARAVGIQVPALYFLVLVPISALVGTIPLTPNGLGFREGALLGLVVLFGAEPATAGAFVILALAIAMAFAAVGGLVYPFYRRGGEESTGAASTS